MSVAKVGQGTRPRPSDGVTENRQFHMVDCIAVECYDNVTAFSYGVYYSNYYLTQNIFLLIVKFVLLVTGCVTGRPVNYQDIRLCNRTTVTHPCGTYYYYYYQLQCRPIYV